MFSIWILNIETKTYSDSSKYLELDSIHIEISMWIVCSAIDYPPELLHLNLIVSKIILEKVVSKILSAR
jgi:hypothetical protein